MLIAVIAGAGVFLGVLALSVDIGRFLVVKRQVQAAADSTVQTLLVRCAKVGVGCADAITTANAIDLTLQPTAVKRVGACWFNGTTTTCTAGYSAASAISSCPALVNKAGNALGATDPWMRIVVTNRNPVYGLFLGQSDAKYFTGCGQGVWWTGTTHTVPRVLLFPACQIGTVGQNTFLYQQTSTPAHVASNSGSQNWVSTRVGRASWRLAAPPPLAR